MEKISITEADHIEQEWFADAKKQTVETLPDFINHVMNDYVHDYGTICHAVSACAIAAGYAADRCPSGGITGFQASFVMWDFVRQWSFPNNKIGMKLLNMDDLMYPQYEEKFRTTITTSQFEKLQDVCRENIKEHNETGRMVHPSVLKHWESIIAGNVPFGIELKNC